MNWDGPVVMIDATNDEKNVTVSTKYTRFDHSFMKETNIAPFTPAMKPSAYAATPSIIVTDSSGHAGSGTLWPVGL